MFVQTPISALMDEICPSGADLPLARRPVGFAPKGDQSLNSNVVKNLTEDPPSSLVSRITI